MSAKIYDPRSAILAVLQKEGGSAGVVRYDGDLLELFERQGISHAQANVILEELEEEGLVTNDADGYYALTPEGRYANTVGVAPAQGGRTMAEKIADQNARKVQRLRLLDAVYERTGGNPHAAFLMAEAFSDAGLTYEDGMLAFNYLAKEGLLDGHTSNRLSITHEGVKEREAAIEGGGDESTDHFPAQVIQNVVHIHGGNFGSVQTGGEQNSSTVTTRNTGATPVDLAPLLAEAGKVAVSLQGPVRDEVLATLEKLKAQLEKAEPHHGLATMYAKALSTVVELAPIANKLLGAIAGVGM